MNTNTMNVKQASEYLGIGQTSLRELCRSEKIKHMRIGPSRGLIRFQQDWLDDYLKCSVVDVASERKKPKRATSVSLDSMNAAIAGIESSF